ncbi:MAG: DUF2726 domain-containing protein [Muribaculaceae bacterium]|nr:DUF2726 domain-containing protein [Muribaculaceae bacterium]
MWHDPLYIKVYINGREERNVADVRSFSQGHLTHWRITYGNGYVRDYLHGTIHVIHSCLEDAKSKNTFEYLKRIALINELGKDEEHGGILPQLYEKIEFIDDQLAIAPYLNPLQNKVNKYRVSSLVFPFNCNASQERSVTAAFENQISVIQGPPGTGKTQTILNIIANILLHGKTVMVVSNNNSATENILEKLQKNGLGFIVAPLGKRDNKENFIQNQPHIPQELQNWAIEPERIQLFKRKVENSLSALRKVFAFQEKLATLRLEMKAVELEWHHFKLDNDINENSYHVKRNVKAKRLMKLWLQFQTYAEGEATSHNFLRKLKDRLKWSWLNFTRKFLLGIQSPFDPTDIQPTVLELQALYLQVRLREINNSITSIEHELHLVDAKTLNNELTMSSLALLKDALYRKYSNEQRRIFADVKELTQQAERVCEQYPVILSTTFSARTSLPNTTYDYIIMDEASQVSIDTGALALTCATNAIIVGDSMQLPNVVTKEDKLKLDGIFAEFKVSQGYNSGKYCFLLSVCTIIPQVQQTLLREHYRCHPTIINFCNQRFYGGNLLVMTEDHDEPDVMMAVKTVPGHHCRNHFNQREIDVVREEILPKLSEDEEVGIITPYNFQVNEFNQQLPAIEAATVHKYQGREKDTIIMSVVDDEITEFSDDPNLINVAISRAKKRFFLVVSGNDQEIKGNISDLIDYIEYHNLSVTDSKISSIFDYLYGQYTTERISFLSGHKNVSEYDSENLTYSLIENIFRDYPEYSHLGVLCHTPLRNVIRDWSLLNEDERKYISHFSTHLDFLIINHVTKKPVFAIETDGYNYHNHKTEQHRRDFKKNHILSLYRLPLLRLKTNESREKDKILSMLHDIIKL